jgi:putative sterol carrier protein
MADAIAEFFDGLGRLGHEPLLERVKGTLRFDLEGGDGATTHWFVAIDRGDIAVSHKNVKADTIVRTSGALFQRLVTGETNAVTAVLRGLVGIDGDPSLLLRFQRALRGRISSPETVTAGAGKARS